MVLCSTKIMESFLFVLKKELTSNSEQHLTVFWPFNSKSTIKAEQLWLFINRADCVWGEWKRKLIFYYLEPPSTVTLLCFPHTICRRTSRNTQWYLVGDVRASFQMQLLKATTRLTLTYVVNVLRKCDILLRETLSRNKENECVQLQSPVQSISVQETKTLV